MHKPSPLGNDHGQARRTGAIARLSHARLERRARTPRRLHAARGEQSTLRRDSELFIEIMRFIWDANPSYDVYREFSQRHHYVPYKVHELIAARLKAESAGNSTPPRRRAGSPPPGGFFRQLFRRRAAVRAGRACPGRKGRRRGGITRTLALDPVLFAAPPDLAQPPAQISEWICRSVRTVASERARAILHSMAMPNGGAWRRAAAIRALVPETPSRACTTSR